MSGLKLVTYKNKPYSIMLRKKGKQNIIIAEINVHGGRAEGTTEEEAIENLQAVLGKLEHASNVGKDKMLLG